MTTSEPTITHNQPKQRFELVIDGKRSLVTYFQPDEQTLALAHTEVHPDLEGKGVGSNLVKQVFMYCEAHNLKIVPLCPFITVYLKRHPDWQRIVSTTHDVADF